MKVVVTTNPRKSHEGATTARAASRDSYEYVSWLMERIPRARDQS